MAEKSKFNKVKYDADYKRKNYKRLSVLVPLKDAELLEYIESKKSVSSYLLELAKKDFESSKS